MKLKDKKEKETQKKTAKKRGKLLKALARGNLYGKYGPLIAATLIVLILPVLIMFPFNRLFNLDISNIAAVIVSGAEIEWAKVVAYYGIRLIVSVFMAVLTIGIYRMNLEVARGEKPTFSMLLFGFSENTLQCIILAVIIMLLNNVFTWPGMICQAVAMLYDGQTALIINIVGLVLLIVGGIALIVVALGVSMAYYVIADGLEEKATAAVKKSFQLMKKQKLRYLGLVLSFVGWLLLGVCSLGIGLLWIRPYMEQTKAVLYLDLRGELDETLAKRAQRENDNK